MSSGTPPTKPWQKAGNDSGSNTHKPWQGGTQTASVENSPVTRPSRPWEDSEEGAARAGTSTVAPVSGALNSPTSTSYGVGGIGTGYGGYSPYNTYGSYGKSSKIFLNLCALHHVLWCASLRKMSIMRSQLRITERISLLLLLSVTCSACYPRVVLRRQLWEPVPQPIWWVRLLRWHVWWRDDGVSLRNGRNVWQLRWRFR